MNDPQPISHEDELLQKAADKGPLGKAAIYTRLSGPGWLQGAITLGGGSLAGALYLGVIMGYQHDVVAADRDDPGRDHAQRDQLRHAVDW